jgi:hypothetical protein
MEDCHPDSQGKITLVGEPCPRPLKGRNARKQQSLPGIIISRQEIMFPYRKSKNLPGILNSFRELAKSFGNTLFPAGNGESFRECFIPGGKWRNLSEILYFGREFAITFQLLTEKFDFRASHFKLKEQAMQFGWSTKRFACTLFNLFYLRSELTLFVSNFPRPKRDLDETLFNLLRHQANRPFL